MSSLSAYWVSPCAWKMISIMGFLWLLTMRGKIAPPEKVQKEDQKDLNEDSHMGESRSRQLLA